MKMHERLLRLEAENRGLRAELSTQRRWLVCATVLVGALWLGGASGETFQEVVKARRFEVIGGPGQGFAVVTLEADEGGFGQVRVSNEAGYNLFRAGSAPDGAGMELGDGSGRVAFGVRGGDASTTLVLGDGKGGTAVEIVGGPERVSFGLRSTDGIESLRLAAVPVPGVELKGPEGRVALNLGLTEGGEGRLLLANEAGQETLQLGGFGRARRRIAASASGGGIIASWPAQPAATPDEVDAE
jgi:hypothetical protein